MFNFRLFSIGALLAGPFLIVMNFLDTAEKEKIDREGVAVTAIPHHKREETGRKGKRTYKLQVDFPVEGGGVKTAEIKVSREVYDNIESNPALKIKYLKEDTSKILVVGDPISVPAMYFLGAGAFAIGLFGCWWYFIRK